ncbi:MAG: DUF6111 family protein [Rhodospirillaceae bacterium]|nr:DUF6111 family protein [Rhodospirillaceae bacterium]
MIRIIFTYVLPLVLPSILYFIWMGWVRRKIDAAKRAGEDVEHLEIKTPWIRLVLAGVLLMAIGLGIIATVGGSPAGSSYQPPRFEDGKIVPGEMTPK